MESEPHFDHFGNRRQIDPVREELSTLLRGLRTHKAAATFTHVSKPGKIVTGKNSNDDNARVIFKGRDVNWRPVSMQPAELEALRKSFHRALTQTESFLARHNINPHSVVHCTADRIVNLMTDFQAEPLHPSYSNAKRVMELMDKTLDQPCAFEA